MTGEHNVGKSITVRAPIGEPPVFIRDCDAMNQFVSALTDKGIIKNHRKSKSRIKRRWVSAW